MSDIYEALASSFIEESNVDNSGKSKDELWEEQFMIIKEEYEELGNVVEEMRALAFAYDSVPDEAQEEFDKRAAEELADLCITTFTAAEVLGIDLRKAFSKKMAYNLTKSGDEVVDGKIQDDTDREKPDFGGVFYDED